MTFKFAMESLRSIRFYDVVALLSCLLALGSMAAGDCTHSGWTSHQLKVVGGPPYSVINATNSKGYFGVEGGHLIAVPGIGYVIGIAEFTAKPLFVPSNIAIFTGKDDQPASIPTEWARNKTVFQSEGKVECNTNRASLGSSVALAWNETDNHWEMFYVGFLSCNDSHFVNRHGQIYRSVSQVPGKEGVSGPYTDMGVVLSPEIGGHRDWEGLQGVDSMQPYKLPGNAGYAAFYGSANTQDSQENVIQQVSMAFAPSLAGPWQKKAGGAVNLSQWETHIEQPMVTQFRDGSYGAVFDSLTHQGKRMVGYSWSPDGVAWDPECSQLLDVGAASPWMKMGSRTPQGLVEMEDGSLIMTVTGYDNSTRHESLGICTLQFMK